MLGLTRQLALSIATGVEGIALVALVAAVLQYRHGLKRLKPHLEHKRLSVAEIVAVLVAGFGILVWLSAIIRSW